MTKQNPSTELLAFLREEVGVVPQKGDIKFPTRKQAITWTTWKRVHNI